MITHSHLTKLEGVFVVVVIVFQWHSLHKCDGDEAGVLCALSSSSSLITSKSVPTSLEEICSLLLSISLTSILELSEVVSSKFIFSWTFLGQGYK